MADEKDVVKLYSRNCMRCAHLCPSLTKTFTCTPENGNTECPAQALTFVVTPRNRLVEAALRGDTDEVQRRLDKLKNDPEKFAKALRKLSEIGANPK